jgi:hypothetical protein
VYIREHHILRGRTAAYNSPKPTMRFRSRALGACCVLILLTPTARASDWKGAETELTQKITGVTGPGVVALDMMNRSSIPSPEVEQIRRELVSLLGTLGVRVWDPDKASATIKLTLSENRQSYVWVAQVQQAANQQNVLMVSMPRPDSAIPLQNAPPLVLHATSVFSQPEKIIDFAILDGNPRRMLTLGAAAATAYEFKDGRWISGQSLAIKTPVPMPRDLRGRIFLRKDHLFDVYLPGLACRSTASSPLNMNCQQSDDPWPLQSGESGVSGFFSPARNFFTGALVPGILKQKSAPAFYSAAAIPRQNYTLWLLTGLDGQLHMLDGINDQVASRVQWGSEIAGVRAGCRPGAQVIATTKQDDGPDSVQAYEIPDREPVAVSQKLELNGTLTALWTGQSGDSATAVIRNSGTGNYDALQISLTCGQ